MNNRARSPALYGFPTGSRDFRPASWNLRTRSSRVRSAAPRCSVACRHLPPRMPPCRLTGSRRAGRFARTASAGSIRIAEQLWRDAALRCRAPLSGQLPGMLVAMRPVPRLPQVSRCRVRRAALRRRAAVIPSTHHPRNCSSTYPKPSSPRQPTPSYATGAWRQSSAPSRCGISPAPAAQSWMRCIYSEYDRNGILVTAGNAVRAVYYTEREDAEVAGAIRLRSQSQGVWLDAETLRWEDAEPAGCSRAPRRRWRLPATTARRSPASVSRSTCAARPSASRDASAAPWSPHRHGGIRNRPTPRDRVPWLRRCGTSAASSGSRLPGYPAAPRRWKRAAAPYPCR